MPEFVKVNKTLINANRVLAVRHRPEDAHGSFRSVEHYLVVFDTGQEVRLSPEDGLLLIKVMLPPITEQSV